MTDIPDWLWQNMVAGLINEALLTSAEGLLLLSNLGWRNRHKLAAKLKRSPQAQILLSGTIQSSSSVFGSTLTVDKSLNLRWNTETPTPSPALRVLDEGLELLALLQRHW